MIIRQQLDFISRGRTEVRLCMPRSRGTTGAVRGVAPSRFRLSRGEMPPDEGESEFLDPGTLRRFEPFANLFWIPHHPFRGTQWAYPVLTPMAMAMAMIHPAREVFDCPMCHIMGSHEQCTVSLVELFRTGACAGASLALRGPGAHSGVGIA